MTNRERLHELADHLPELLAGEVVDFAEFLAAKSGRRAGNAETDPELEAQDRAWLDSDLSGLGDLEPYDWGPGGPPEGKPVRYVPGEGFVIEGGRGA